MKYAILTLAGSILMGFAVLADSIRTRHSSAEILIVIGGIVMLLGVIGVAVEKKLG